jgi:hypothetical protein
MKSGTGIVGALVVGDGVRPNRRFYRRGAAMALAFEGIPSQVNVDSERGDDSLAEIEQSRGYTASWEVGDLLRV